MSSLTSLAIGFSPTANLGIGATLRIEDVVDFANTRLGRSNRLSPFIRLQFGRHLQFNLSHTLQQFDVEGGRLFTANLSDLRTTYQFTAKSFLSLHTPIQTIANAISCFTSTPFSAAAKTSPRSCSIAIASPQQRAFLLVIRMQVFKTTASIR